ncbi:TrmB family transcriptional regulator [Amycolatopsis sp. NPDC049868]|uniref:TrmB family transcriptional regulator n=1 Tax=Amycolatopsis sp. NPDC049868 TaxID=3363934 RepID=UPI003792E8F0
MKKNMIPTAAQMKVLGLTEWESRAYLALLEESPSSGYGVAKRSGVPRAKVYEVLDSLEHKGAVHVTHGEPRQYGPVPPKELVARAREEMLAGLDLAEAAMTDYAEQQDTNAVIWDIQGREEIIARARQLIQGAAHQILLEIWATDAGELRRDLKAAVGRGVEVTAVAYGDPEYPFARVYPHPLTDEVTKGLGGRWLVLSIDNREVIAGNVSGAGLSRAAWTTHPGLVVPVTELVRHDLYKLEVLSSHGDVLEAAYGPGLSVLREKFGAGEQRPEDPGE